MNLEHVSVENSHGRQKHRPPQKTKSKIYPRRGLETNCKPRSPRADIDQILFELSAKGLFAKAHIKAYLHDMYLTCPQFLYHLLS